MKDNSMYVNAKFVKPRQTISHRKVNKILQNFDIANVQCSETCSDS